MTVSAMHKGSIIDIDQANGACGPSADAGDSASDQDDLLG